MSVKPPNEFCRACEDEGERVPADLILWGKLFPPEALGPRCLEHAAPHMNHFKSPISQWAVFDLRPYR